MKKGLSTLIGALLLIMIIVGLGGFVAYWIYGYSDKSFGSIDNLQSSILLGDEGKITILSSEYSFDSEILSLTLRNSGGKSIPLDNSSNFPTTTWILQHTQGRQVCNTNWDGTDNSVACFRGCGTNVELDIGKIQNIDLNLSGSPCDLSTLDNFTIYEFHIDFSGKAKAAGLFEKQGYIQ